MEVRHRPKLYASKMDERLASGAESVNALTMPPHIPKQCTPPNQPMAIAERSVNSGIAVLDHARITLPPFRGFFPVCLEICIKSHRKDAHKQTALGHYVNTLCADLQKARLGQWL